MREIKFRAYVKNEQKMLPVYSLGFSIIDEWPITVASCGDLNCGLCLDFYEKKDVELMQFTGLKDKNGKEIYESDIVQVYRLGVCGTFQVIWREGGVPMYILYPQPINESGMWNLRSDMSMSIEVIGNIFENPDLLNT